MAVLLILSLSLAMYTAGYAITSFYKQLVGVGNVSFSQEVNISDIKIAGSDKVKVNLTSTALTEADYVYTVSLYLDFVNIDSTTVSYTAGQIPAFTKKVDFTGVALGGATDIGVEVTR